MDISFFVTCISGFRIVFLAKFVWLFIRFFFQLWFLQYFNDFYVYVSVFQKSLQSVKAVRPTIASKPLKVVC